MAMKIACRRHGAASGAGTVAVSAAKNQRVAAGHRPDARPVRCGGPTGPTRGAAVIIYTRHKWCHQAHKIMSFSLQL
jgi:hypothetical protein